MSQAFLGKFANCNARKHGFVHIQALICTQTLLLEQILAVTYMHTHKTRTHTQADYYKLLLRMHTPRLNYYMYIAIIIVNEPFVGISELTLIPLHASEGSGLSFH